MNSMLKKVAFLAWFAVLFLADVRAQEIKASIREVPQAPYIAKLPKTFCYTMRIEGAKGEKKPTELASVVITKLDDAKGVVELFGDGKSKEFWICDGLVLIKQVGMSKPGVYAPIDVSVEVPVSSADFTGFDWISPNSYLGTATSEGKKCYVFENGDMRALIDVATRLPESLKQGNLLYHFEYGAQPPDNAKMPPEFDERWQQHLASMKAITGKSGPR